MRPAMQSLLDCETLKLHRGGKDVPPCLRIQEIHRLLTTLGLILHMYDGGPKESGQCPVAFSFKCVHPLCLNHTSTYFYDLSSHLEDSHSAHRMT